jgi:hypothetical protein
MTSAAALRTALALYACIAAVPSAGADDAKQRQDLTAVIALQGKPCGEVVKVEELAPNDYVATCKDGNRYHVYVNPQGRVTVDRK